MSSILATVRVSQGPELWWTHPEEGNGLVSVADRRTPRPAGTTKGVPDEEWKQQEGFPLISKKDGTIGGPPEHDRATISGFLGKEAGGDNNEEFPLKRDRGSNSDTRYSTEETQW